MKAELEAHAAKMRERRRVAALRREEHRKAAIRRNRRLAGEKRLHRAGLAERKSFGEHAFAIEMLSVRQEAEAWKHRVPPVRIR